METFAFLVSQPPPPPRTLNTSVPAGLEAICLKCLEKDQKRRHGSAGELAVDLERFLTEPPAPARSASLWKRLPGILGLGTPPRTK